MHEDILKIKVNVGGAIREIDLSEIIELNSGSGEEFFDPYEIGIKIDKVALFRTIIYSAYIESKKVRRVKHAIFRKVEAIARRNAEKKILESRRKEIEEKKRDKIGQLTAVQVDDYLAFHDYVYKKSEEEFLALSSVRTEYKDARDDEERLMAMYEGLKSRSIELGKLLTVCLSEFNSSVSYRKKETKKDGDDF